jgi:uncharacterized damage-inducible protein DinB
MVIEALVHEFRKIKQLADRAIAQLSDAELHQRLDGESNSVATLMVHMAGNMRSRWTDFLTTDGEKPWRTRDAEFEPTALSRDALLAAWEGGWQTVFDALTPLTDAELGRTVTIRGESLTVLTAALRQVSHYAGHTHQIVLLGKHLRGPAWTVLSIPRGQSATYTADTRRAAGRG